MKKTLAILLTSFTLLYGFSQEKTDKDTSNTVVVEVPKSPELLKYIDQDNALLKEYNAEVLSFLKNKSTNKSGAQSNITSALKLNEKRVKLLAKTASKLTDDVSQTYFSENTIPSITLPSNPSTDHIKWFDDNFTGCTSPWLNDFDRSNAYELRFKVDGLADTVVKLAYHKGENKLLVDSAFVDCKGRFTFKGNKRLPGGIYLVVIPNQPYFEFLINKDYFMTFTTDTLGMMKNMQIEGSKENESFYKYLNQTTPLRKKLDELSKEYAKLKDSIPEQAEPIKAEAIALNTQLNKSLDSIIVAEKGTFVSAILKGMEPIENAVPLFTEIEDKDERQKARFNWYKEHYFDYVSLSDERFVRTPILQPKIEKYIESLTVQVPDSINKAADKLIAQTGDCYECFKNMVITITQKYEKSQIMCIDQVTYHMYKTYFLDSNRVDWISKETRDKIEKEVWKIHYNICGKTSYPLNVPDTAGVMHNLHSLKNEHVLVVFWSATCGHCKKTMPKLHKKYIEEWKAKNNWDIEIFTVHIDDNDKALKAFVKEHKLSWITTNDPDDTSHFRQAYNIYSTPVFYLLDKDKKIIAKRIDIETTEKILEDFYSKKK